MGVGMAITENIIDFSKLTTEEKHELFQRLWEFDQCIFPTSKIEQLYQYMHDPDIVALPIIQYFEQIN
jgi:hypothetical protein